MTFKMMMIQWVNCSEEEGQYMDPFYYLTGNTKDVYYKCQEHLNRNQQITIACLFM